MSMEVILRLVAVIHMLLMKPLCLPWETALENKHTDVN